jgi:glutamate formiminotransferase/formiminotetrahydrofolate cyclodeaminase
MAAELIDMRKHKGEHPRMGATDVCPFVPIRGISNEEAVALARQLAERVAKELDIPVYLYEYAATEPKRKSLANIRAGEYEGLAEKIKQKEWKPDYGKAKFNPQSGATVIGVRDFLIAYNVNLNTTSVRRANSVAFDVREAGRILREGDPVTGKVVLDDKGEPVRVPGMLKHCRGIGWYIEEYGIAQVSMNLTNIHETPLHEAFEACCTSAQARGMRVTGSELVGLVPLQSLLNAGKHFLRKQGRSAGVSERELVHIAVKSLGLDELAPFDPQKRVLEYCLAAGEKPGFGALSIRQFLDEVASESAAPGGGSVSGIVASLGAALGAMVANGSANKRGWDHRAAEFSETAEPLQAIKDQLVKQADADTAAFNRVMEAYALPKDTEAEKTTRAQAIEAANQGATLAPLNIVKTCAKALPFIYKMAESGNPNAITDVGCGSLALHAAAHGAALNVRVNLGSIADADFKASVLAELKDTLLQLDTLHAMIMQKVEAGLGK